MGRGANVKLPGDAVIVRSQQGVADGELAAVLVGDEATIKTVRIEDGRVVLIPSNPSYDPIVANVERSSIISKVVGLIRSY